ncbi:MAG: hypothetical protein H0U36_12505 [Nocardioidaceae bacterium]|nr:hypothetical protein [Nocardioidaceae bacterium]
MAHPNKPGVTNWMVCSEASSTRSVLTVYFGGWPLAATFADWTNDRRVPCATAA